MNRLIIFITGRNELVAKVIFLHLSVILFTGGGVCLSACWDTTPPWEQTPPRSRHTPPMEQTPPLDETPPGSRHPPPGSRHTFPEQTPPRADTPLEQTPLEQTPPEQTPPWSRAPPPEQTPPPKADSGIRSMSGRYASYWNAFLFPFAFQKCL